MDNNNVHTYKLRIRDFVPLFGRMEYWFRNGYSKDERSNITSINFITNSSLLFVYNILSLVATNIVSHEVTKNLEKLLN